MRVSPDEVEFVPLRAQGPGGQNVNKVSSAVQLRFDVAESSLPEQVKARLLALADQRLNRQGVLVIKAQAKRSQEQNRLDALARLDELVEKASIPLVRRRPTKPTHGSKLRRLESKLHRAKLKAARARTQD